MIQNISARPTIVLVHGAWRTTACFDKLIPLLNQTGYPTFAIQLPSAVDAESTDSDDDVRAVRAKLTDLVQAQKDIVVFMHSYGGFPGSEAVREFSTKTRTAQGLRGGVTHLIYCAAFVTPKGQAVIPGKQQPASWLTLSDDTRTSTPIDAKQRFYGDLDPDEGDKCASLVAWQSMAVFDGRSSYSAFKNIESIYICCELDQALPVAYQHHLIETLGKQYFRVITFTSSHSPFLSMPTKVVEVVKNVCR